MRHAKEKGKRAQEWREAHVIYGLRAREKSCKKGLVFNVLCMKLPEIEV